MSFRNLFFSNFRNIFYCFLIVNLSFSHSHARARARTHTHTHNARKTKLWKRIVVCRHGKYLL